ncbi:MAG: hypothetical protein P4L51_17240 [Puia sp.]|nr:hypothetical protein [Puia sp.]
MKKHAPIKRHQALVSFSKDHHFGLLLVWKIRQGLQNAVTAERISNYLLYSFNEQLALHFKEEEESLFCQLSSEDILRKTAEEDHKAIYNLVAAISVSKDDPGQLDQFATKLEKHIRFEERELFIHLQNKMATVELEKIADRLSNSSTAADNDWEDKFWEIGLSKTKQRE